MILNSAKRELLEAELLSAEGLAPKGRSLTGDAMRRLLRNKAAALSLVILAVLVLVAIFGPYFLPFNYEDPDWTSFRGAPDFAAGHYFGTDGNGRDLLARTLYGTRVSLTVALVATLVSVVIGVLYGAVAGYFGGRVDAIMMRFVDIMYALPYVLFVILLMVIFGRNVYLLFAAIGALEWLTMARIVRGQTLSIKQREFIEAARASGQRSFKIILKHIVPNLVGPVVIYATLTIPEIIATESFLSYLGFGVQEPLTSLGTLIAEGSAGMETTPWLLFFPAGFLVALLMSLLFIGDGLRDAFDPKDR
ncbi:MULTISPECIES: ABC transporter permease subunit [Rhizobium]|jgi:oligopeptide transport system permease protein|uniref:Oligopeptide transport system permease protein OppC n=3 Tax=Rhizobium TaxID=379 RepID=A0ABU1SNC3_9HYPH|nr:MULTISPECIES: ABC transporter permease subunit [Rhizobium]ASW07245.1 peptide ABC transporter permease [Rhizobium sp. 11515TR]MBB3287752.1 oligopeptide transport system permease protein [Rhizobium sp. BK252]MBB3381617.1 oligopeptide transport system permease protein [Rhizobium sp. BK098]MBB3402644.1 oligopeptide transport system permease protein [Rhizobium sp. BK289]MBB3415220.1 oligopeptide transport system permease protein [Rhizobium sp. BK284]